MGSASDSAIGDDIKKHCNSLGLSLERRIMSAHKVTEETLDTVAYVSCPGKQLSDDLLLFEIDLMFP